MSSSEKPPVTLAAFAEAAYPSAAPASARHRSRRSSLWLDLLLALYALFLGGLSLANALGPERWWLSTLNLYLPQWPWAIPGALLLLISLAVSRLRALPALLLLLWALGPVMGLSWRMATPPADPAAGTPLRVMTYNIKLNRRDDGAIMLDIRDNKVDVLLLQEASRIGRTVVGDFLKDWNVIRDDQYLIACRAPFKLSGHKHLRTEHVRAVRCRLERAGMPTVTLFTVHFLTPRRGLTAVRHKDVEGVDELEREADLRMKQAQEMAGLLREVSGPILVTGDLNAPMHSNVLRTLTETGLRDAFSEAGRGYGYTYGSHVRYLNHPYLRIDHILMSREWRALNCWTGNEAGADHRPVIADLYLPHTP